MTRESLTELRKLVDGAAKYLHALKALKRPTVHWDDLLLHVLGSKLDAITLREWRSSLTGTELPTMQQFFDFIMHQCQTLEDTERPDVASAKSAVTRSQSRAKCQAACSATVKSKCTYCQREHSIYYCKKFTALSVPRRISEIRDRKICSNCLRASHAPDKCTSGHCRVCQAKHNTLLHVAASQSASSGGKAKAGNDSNQADNPVALAIHALGVTGVNQVMLSTAVAYAYDNKKVLVPCRVLLDSGSQVNFISKRFLTLGLQPRSLNISISGVSGTAAASTQTVRVKVQSRLNPFTAVLDCIVMEQVTDKIPAFNLKRSAFDFPRNIQSAEPHFNVSSEIDLLIGAELFWDLLCIGQVKSSSNHPTLQKTQLGWILAGRLSGSGRPSVRVQSFHTSISNVQLHNQVSRLWQLDAIDKHSNNYTYEENLCEQFFLNSVSQNSQGRYIVKLPVKESVLNKLGESRTIALKRLQGLERRLSRNPDLKNQYTNFIEEYLSLGHMRKVFPHSDEGSTSFSLPHHCVFKSSNQASKIRVVFDASCKTSSGVALNDALMTGPIVQQDLFSILVRFRTFRYVITSDIIKMYRQVLLDSSQTPLQRILWRNEASADIDTYELVTLTYGTASASYLATRCLRHLADQHASQYPVGSLRVKRDFYVDDLLTGADTIREAKLIRDETIQLLRLGAFELSKWASNCTELLEPLGKRHDGLVRISEESDSSILGVQWNQSEDTFRFSCNLDPKCDAVSKRTILSEVARLFDPLGLLGPVTVIARLIIQDLWQSGTHWDESVPQVIHTRWLEFRSQLPILNQLQILRRAKPASNPQVTQLHGFCDASMSAYGAAVYLRSEIAPNEYRSELLCSKSRIAPLKTVSLPRLELSAAELLACLIKKVEESMDLARIQVFLWSDSTIALSWIASTSRRWSMFVANSVGEIQDLTEIRDWHHVSSSNNPADILSA